MVNQHFINTIKDLMGEYGKQAKSDTFIKKKDTGANNDIARLVNATLCFCNRK
jgi:putative DNA primase/helicase